MTVTQALTNYLLQLADGRKLNLVAPKEPGATGTETKVPGPTEGRTWRALLWRQAPSASSHAEWYAAVCVRFPPGYLTGSPLILRLTTLENGEASMSAVTEDRLELNVSVWRGQRGRWEKRIFEEGYVTPHLNKLGVLHPVQRCEHPACTASATVYCTQCGRPVCPSHQLAKPGWPVRCAECTARLTRQLLACGVKADMLDAAAVELELYVNQYRSFPAARAYLARVRAHQGQYDAALALMDASSPNPSDGADANATAAHIYMLGAKQAMARGDFMQAAVRVADALRREPSSAHIQQVNELLTGWQVASFLEKGQFDQGAAIWERQFRQNPTDLLLLHQLAILYQRAASVADPVGQPPVAGADLRELPNFYWGKAIAAWATVLHSRAFWTAWGSKRKEQAGYTVEGLDLDDVITSVTEQMVQEYRERSVQNTAYFGELERLWLFECKTALLMSECPIHEYAAAWPADYACGPLMLAQLRALPNAAPLVLGLQQACSKMKDPPGRTLCRYLSPNGRQHFLIDERRFEQAIGEMEAQEVNPETNSLLVDALLGQAEDLVQLHQWEQVMVLLARASSRGAELTRFADALAKAAVEQAKAILHRDPAHYQAAIAVLEQAHAIVGTHPDVDANLAATYAQAARVRNNADDFEDAARLIRLSLQFGAPDSMTLHFAQVVTANLAVHVLKTDRDRFLALAKESLSYEDNTDVRRLLSSVLFEMMLQAATAKKRERAIALMQDRIRYDPESTASPTVGEARQRISTVLFNEAVRFGNEGQLRKAIEMAQEARIYEDDSVTRQLLAGLFYQENRYDDAIQILRAEAKTSPQDKHVLLLLEKVLLSQAVSFNQSGRIDAAIALLKEALTLQKSPEIRRTLGVLLHNSAVQMADRGQYDQAIARFIEALSYNDDQTSRSMLAQTYGLRAVQKFQHGDRWGARLDLQEGLKYNPSDDSLRSALYRLS